MSRIQATLAALATNQGLIPFITAGDPAPELTVPLMHALVRGGTDILELGVPFSDPMAEGSVIQRACERALKFGVSLHDVLGYVREFRRDNGTTPVVLMGYANPLERMGVDAFIAVATAKAVAQVSDAVVIGSRIIQELENTPREQSVAAVENFLSGIRKALDA